MAGRLYIGWAEHLEVYFGARFYFHFFFLCFFYFLAHGLAYISSEGSNRRYGEGKGFVTGEG